MPIGWSSGDGGQAGMLEPPASEPIDEAQITVWTRWRTAEDERVCPECGPLDGAAWPQDEGPTPPLHDRCRCGREFAFTERTTGF